MSIIQHLKEPNSSSTLNIQPIKVEDDDCCTQLMVVSESDGGPVQFQLPNGSHAIIHNEQQHNEDGVDGLAIELEDGRVEYYQSFAVQDYISGIPPTVTIRHTQNEIKSENTITKYICNFPGCDKVFMSRNYFKTHERVHQGLRPYVCYICEKDFNTTYARKAHIRTHTGEKPYPCTQEQCQKRFKTSGDLHKHIRTHTGERPFKCEICNKSFTTSNIRKVHMRVHTGERPYKCDLCVRSFASATNYRNHCRIHTGEKPFVCSVQNCGKRFTEYSSLYKHHMVHNYKKRHSCQVCGKHYRQLSALSIHKKTAHGLDNNDEDIVDDIKISNEQQYVSSEEQQQQIVILNSGLEVEMLPLIEQSENNGEEENTQIISTIESITPAGSLDVLDDKNPQYLEIRELGSNDNSSQDDPSNYMKMTYVDTLIPNDQSSTSNPILVLTNSSQIAAFQEFTTDS